MGRQIALCGFCGKPMSGSRIVITGNQEADVTALAAVYLIHVIDHHWELVERIRATSGDGDARLRLNEELRAGR